MISSRLTFSRSRMRYFMRLATVMLLLIVEYTAWSQEGWNTYLAQYENKPGSTSLNMKLVDVAPVKEFPFLVSTGVTYTNCDEDGFPNEIELIKLYVISDSAIHLVTSTTKAEVAGSFIHDCVRLDYIYVNDTTGLRDKLSAMYSRRFKSYEPYIHIEPDPEWALYLEFLYPNEEILDWMSNEEVLERLTAAGDNLEKPRTINHWIYFKTESDRAAFMKYTREQKFQTEGVAYSEESNPPYQLHISRVDKVDAETINMITLTLKRKAAEFNGDYDGWQCIVVKD